MRDNSWKEESLKSYYHPIIHFRFNFQFAENDESWDDDEKVTSI